MAMAIQKWISVLFVSCVSLGFASGYTCNLNGININCPDGCCGSSCCSCYNYDYHYYQNERDSLIIAVIVLSVLVFIALVIGCISCIVRCSRRNSPTPPSVMMSVATIPGQPPVCQIYPPYHNYLVTQGQGVTGTPRGQPNTFG